MLLALNLTFKTIEHVWNLETGPDLPTFSKDNLLLFVYEYSHSTRGAWVGEYPGCFLASWTSRETWEHSELVGRRPLCSEGGPWSTGTDWLWPAFPYPVESCCLELACLYTDLWVLVQIALWLFYYFTPSNVNLPGLCVVEIEKEVRKTHFTIKSNWGQIRKHYLPQTALVLHFLCHLGWAQLHRFSLLCLIITSADTKKQNPCPGLCSYLENLWGNEWCLL